MAKLITSCFQRSPKIRKAMKVCIGVGLLFGIIVAAHNVWGAEAAKKKPKGPKVTEVVGVGFY